MLRPPDVSTSRGWEWKFCPQMNMLEVMVGKSHVWCLGARGPMSDGLMSRGAGRGGPAQWGLMYHGQWSHGWPLLQLWTNMSDNITFPKLHWRVVTCHNSLRKVLCIRASWHHCRFRFRSMWTDPKQPTHHSYLMHVRKLQSCRGKTCCDKRINLNPQRDSIIQDGDYIITTKNHRLYHNTGLIQIKMLTPDVLHFCIFFKFLKICNRILRNKFCSFKIDSRYILTMSRFFF